MKAGARSLGLESGRVVVVPYDPRWPSLFEQNARQLAETLGSAILGVHHVGSTAVPGLCAKPILDVLVTIPEFDRGTDLVPGLRSLGYEFRPDEEIPDRHYFRRWSGTARTHHLSLAEPASRHHRITLAFRDVLRRDRMLAIAYADLKLDLAKRFPRDRQAYLSGKARFIEDALVRAGVGWPSACP